MTDLITAIMPAYNAAATIGPAIRSILSQDDPDWELVVLDDGSSDNTREVAAQAAGGDPRVRILSYPRGGRGVARNRCLEHARGGLIAICDADDISLARRFSIQRGLLRAHPDVSVAACSRVICITNEISQYYVVKMPSTNQEIQSRFRKGRMPIVFASVMIRRGVFARFGGFDPELHRNQDFGFFLKNYRAIEFGTTSESLILVRRVHRTNSFAFIRENNWYRYYANARAKGESRTASQVRETTLSHLYEWTVIPAQFAWYLFKARLLHSDETGLTADEERLSVAAMTATGWK